MKRREVKICRMGSRVARAFFYACRPTTYHPPASRPRQFSSGISLHAAAWIATAGRGSGPTPQFDRPADNRSTSQCNTGKEDR